VVGQQVRRKGEGDEHAEHRHGHEGRPVFANAIPRVRPEARV